MTKKQKIDKMYNIRNALKNDIEFLTIKCYNEGITLQEEHLVSLLFSELSRRSVISYKELTKE